MTVIGVRELLLYCLFAGGKKTECSGDGCCKFGVQVPRQLMFEPPNEGDGTFAFMADVSRLPETPEGAVVNPQSRKQHNGAPAAELVDVSLTGNASY